jgi:hypothetical protein
MDNVVDGAKVDVVDDSMVASVVVLGDAMKPAARSEESLQTRLDSLVAAANCWAELIEDRLTVAEDNSITALGMAEQAVSKSNEAFELAVNAVQDGGQALARASACKRDLVALEERLALLEKKQIQGGRGGQAGQSDHCRYGAKCHKSGCKFGGQNHPDRAGRRANWVRNKGHSIKAVLLENEGVQGTCVCGEVWIQFSDYLHEQCKKCKKE